MVQDSYIALFNENKNLFLSENPQWYIEKRTEALNILSEKEIEEIMVEIDEEIGIKLKAGIGRGKNAEDAAYMADIGLEEIRAHNNEMWTWVIEKEY